MPRGILACDKCVPRGCSCNSEYLSEDYRPVPSGIEGKDWKWLEKDVSFCPIDGKGREFPCCEWWED